MYKKKNVMYKNEGIKIMRNVYYIYISSVFEKMSISLKSNNFSFYFLFKKNI